MKYVFRPSHDKCQDLTEAAGTANCNFPDFPNKRLEGLFILCFADYPPLATPSTVYCRTLANTSNLYYFKC